MSVVDRQIVPDTKPMIMSQDAETMAYSFITVYFEGHVSDNVSMRKDV